MVFSLKNLPAAAYVTSSTTPLKQSAKFAIFISPISVLKLYSAFVSSSITISPRLSSFESSSFFSMVLFRLTLCW